MRLLTFRCTAPKAASTFLTRAFRKARGRPLVAVIPWWGWLLLAGLAWAIGRALIGLAPSRITTPALLASASLMKAFGFLLSWVGPLFCTLMAIFSGLVRATTRDDFNGERIEPSLGESDPTGNSEAAAPPAEPIDTTRWSAALLKALEWKRLEQLSAVYFRTLKFRVEEAAPGPDGGVDLKLYAGATSRPDVFVQCKAWNTWKVGVKPIRELFGVMAAEGVSEGIFITTSSYSNDAIAFARGKNIALIDGEDLLRKLLDLAPDDQAHILAVTTAGDFATPTCPSCGAKMIVRSAGGTGERFWGCPRYPRCRSTMQIRHP